MNKKLQHTTLTLFPSAVCNLNCTYCNISKNTALQTIDQELGEFFQHPQEILIRVKKYFETCALTKMETWGGEPFLHMDRIYGILSLLINEYPYLNDFFSSTNFSFSTWTDQFFGLMQQFKAFPERRFTYTLQISCDGPEELNDLGRGKGTTQKCLENYQRLVKLLFSQLPKNVNLTIVPKPTLNLQTIRLLDTPEKIIEYYKFIEDNFLIPVNDLYFKNVIACPNTPNVGVPCPATQEDGKYFANFVRNCIIANKNIGSILKCYTDTRPFQIHNQNSENLSFYNNVCGCGMGYSNIGLLPNNKISVCNEGFTQMVQEYQYLQAQENNKLKTIEKDRNKGQVNFLCYTEEDYDNFEEKMCNFCYNKNTSILTSLCGQIQLLALSGQIEKQYIIQQNALHAAQKILGEYFCLKDNYNITGTFTLMPIGLLRLFLNGALPYLEQK